MGKQSNSTWGSKKKGLHCCRWKEDKREAFSMDRASSFRFGPLRPRYSRLASATVSVASAILRGGATCSGSPSLSLVTRQVGQPEMPRTFHTSSMSAVGSGTIGRNNTSPPRKTKKHAYSGTISLLPEEKLINLSPKNLKSGVTPTHTHIKGRGAST
ncbi:MAG: hypothetical protein JW384_02268 [Nitrosomonadaceae bacterium]|nr:hypothetical protein [Nitrosomonadaceae bacterium]